MISARSGRFRSRHGSQERSGFSTRHERVWIRLRILPTVVSEIEWRGPDDYANPHARQVSPTSRQIHALYIRGLAGPTVIHDRFSDGGVPGRIRVLEVPVEMVPILSTIIILIRYFLKPGVLSGKNRRI
jgi:hypothetical protein